jgi:hypothetical protein
VFVLKVKLPVVVTPFKLVGISCITFGASILLFDIIEPFAKITEPKVFKSPEKFADLIAKDEPLGVKGFTAD